MKLLVVFYLAVSFSWAAKASFLDSLFQKTAGCPPLINNFLPADTSSLEAERLLRTSTDHCEHAQIAWHLFFFYNGQTEFQSYWASYTFARLYSAGDYKKIWGRVAKFSYTHPELFAREDIRHWGVLAARAIDLELPPGRESTIKYLLLDLANRDPELARAASIAQFLYDFPESHRYQEVEKTLFEVWDEYFCRRIALKQFYSTLSLGLYFKVAVSREKRES